MKFRKEEFFHMAWNKRQHFTADEYRRHAQFHARESLSGRHVPVISGRRYPPLWWLNREIRVFSDPSIPQRTAEVIILAVKERIKEIGLEPFSFGYFGYHPSAEEQVRQSLVRGQLDHEKLFEISASEVWRDEDRGGRLHGDIYITTKSFVDDIVSWGAADFPYGTMMFVLHGNRHENLSFLRKVALHETNHMFGMRGHCDDYQNIEGFPYSTACNMHYSCSHAELCPKCLCFLQNWWVQIEYECNQISNGATSG